ncbi:MAG: 3'-5' exonuclease [Bacteroides sp.]|nr:3'-5' exonuclease [Bacteroides sp.]
MTKLNLDRPIIFFDLETTGTNVTRDRIVEISLIKVLPKGEPIRKCRRINPEMPIPAESTAIHHITDEDVANEPTFRQIARSLYDFFSGCDIAGYNSNKFDVPMLIEEFGRAGIRFDLRDRRLIDVQNIFHKMEQRTLVAAYKFYCGKDLENAHSAAADAEATYEVLLGQLERYDDLKNDIEYLSEFSTDRRNLDLAGRIIRQDDGEEYFNFGKFKGRKCREIFEREPGFFSWMKHGDFPKNTIDVLMGLEAKYRMKK